MRSIVTALATSLLNAHPIYGHHHGTPGRKAQDCGCTAEWKRIAIPVTRAWQFNTWNAKIDSECWTLRAWACWTSCASGFFQFQHSVAFHRREMSLGDHGTESSWHPLEEIHWPLKRIFVWAAVLPRIAIACKDITLYIKYLFVVYFVTWMFE